MSTNCVKCDKQTKDKHKIRSKVYTICDKCFEDVIENAIDKRLKG
ncbi:hypothetical protein [Peptostreptococcus equinus]|uniref:ClpX-type ZB domain-containing protein n=1 Tax=Peptostreptococcus equinus TaxID=3003601 RepID=A0ABY7JTM9_9FIRM|nr:hypothetical protein [Peptostreptococcus sp. CBA3647]WAW15272.1 hypothetical protein O0R46_02135 [Peptostreptococcus sp. CBA3647]